MANLAIKGHSTRGSELIALLEMLGGKNIYNLTGSKEIWHILSNCIIEHSAYLFDEKGFTLEEFLKKFPYKVGDKVNYVKYNDGYPSVYTIQKMLWTGVTIVYLLDSSGLSALTKDLQPYKEETVETITIDDFKANTKEWLIDKLHGMIISEAIKTIGNIHNELHKPKYPKTYKECCDVLGLNTMDNDAQGYEADLIIRFQELLIARDAYWKIAGNWKPYWKDDNDKYFICYLKDELWMSNIRDCNRVLVFPTKEMRDAFYENFKELIEACKELL